MVVVHRQLALLVSSGRGAGCFRRALGALPGEERSVVLDPADQSRAACPLPGKAEEEETWNVCHPATVSQSPVRVKDREIDPGVVGPVTRRPDDGVHVELVSVLEAHGPARDRKSTRLNSSH